MTSTVTFPVLTIDVIGRPRPKGSMRPIGHGRMIEQVDNKDWRAAVIAAAREQVAQPNGELCFGYPCLAPLTVAIDLRFDRPKSAKAGARPSTRSTGDIDKLVRLILDALQDAGVMKDDAQVIQLVATKRFCLQREVPGARIAVEAAS